MHGRRRRRSAIASIIERQAKLRMHVDASDSQRPCRGLREPLRTSRPRCPHQGTDHGACRCSEHGLDTHHKVAVVASLDSASVARSNPGKYTAGERAAEEPESGVDQTRAAVTAGDSKVGGVAAEGTAARLTEHDGVPSHTGDQTSASESDGRILRPQDPDLYALSGPGSWSTLRF